MSEKKPPLGVKPIWLVAEERIKDLSEAIKRLCEDGLNKYKNNRAVKNYSQEIIKFCDLSVLSAISDEEDEEELP